MRTSPVLPIIGAAALAGRAIAADATPSTDNPSGVVYEAVLPDKPFFAGADLEGNVKGSITAIAREDGKGVNFRVMFENLPTEGGPFGYHIHKAAAVDGNCTTTLTHLDPFGAGAEVPCDASRPASCEVGDLSGKHGKITSDPFDVHYVDPYASTNEDSESFFGDLSFVIHYANSTRLTCANFERKAKPEHSQGDDCAAETPSLGEDEGVIETPMPGQSEDDGGSEAEPSGGDEGSMIVAPTPSGSSEGSTDGQGTIFPPPTDGSEGGPAPTPTDGGAGSSPETPVPAGASTERLPASLMALGLAFAAFMF